MRLRYLAAILFGLAFSSPALATDSITNKAQGSTGWTMDLGLDSVTTNLRPLAILVDPTTGLLVPPFQAGNSIGNTSFIATQATAANLNSLVTQGAAASSGPWIFTPWIGGAVNAVGNPLFMSPGTGATWAITASSLPLPALASTSTIQTNGTQKSQIVDGSGNVIASTSNNLDVQCANCSGSGVSTADISTFTPGPAGSLFAGGGGFFQTTATSNPLTTGQQGMFQVTAQRALFTNPRNSSGVEIATSSNPLRIDPTGTTTQPTNMLQIASTTLGNPTAWGTPPTGNVIGANVNIAAGGILGFAAGGTFSGSNGVMTGGEVAGGSLWQPFQLDATTFYLQVDCKAGCTAGTTSNASDAVATSSTNGANVDYLYGFNGTTWDRLRVDASKDLFVNVTFANVAQFNGTTLSTGTGAGGAGIPRVTVSSDSSLTPNGVTSTDDHGTVTTGATFQSIIAASGTRKGCFVQNPTTATEVLYVFFGANASALTANSVSLLAGGSVSCTSGVNVLQDNVSVTATTTGHAFIAYNQ